MLMHFRQIVVPIGILFVALCPTVNFWTQEKPGASVVREVHLTAAVLLFAGGTCVETLRLYFLWCESRAATLTVEGRDSVVCRAPASWSCFFFLSENSDYDPWQPEMRRGGALALATVAVCGWTVESTRRARREAALAASGPLPRSPSEVELMDYTRIPDAEEPASVRADVVGEWA